MARSACGTMMARFDCAAQVVIQTVQNGKEKNTVRKSKQAEIKDEPTSREVRSVRNRPLYMNTLATRQW